jgi:hypothetical protein
VRRYSLILCGLLLTMPACNNDQRSTKVTNVVDPLCRHIVENRKKMIVDTNQAETVWSDGAILEIGVDFPAALQKLISKPTHYHDIRSFVENLDSGNRTAWRIASVHRSPLGPRYSVVKSDDGKISTTVESLYIGYLRQRYPAATIHIRSEFEPIIFLVAQKVRASVMPLKR